MDSCVYNRSSRIFRYLNGKNYCNEHLWIRNGKSCKIDTANGISFVLEPDSIQSEIHHHSDLVVIIIIVVPDHRFYLGFIEGNGATDSIPNWSMISTQIFAEAREEIRRIFIMASPYKGLFLRLSYISMVFFGVTIRRLLAQWTAMKRLR